MWVGNLQVPDNLLHRTHLTHEEECGVIFGRQSGLWTYGTNWAKLVNVHPDPRLHFAMRRSELDPAQWMKVVAIWHTHLDGMSHLPSRKDVQSLPPDIGRGIVLTPSTVTRYHRRGKTITHNIRRSNIR